MQVIHKPKPQPELMTQTELLAYVHELEADKQELLIKHNLSINAYIANINAFGETIKNLKAENARLEESFQRATGEIAADPLPGECRNKAKTIDDFICSQCGINLVDLAFVEKEEYEDGYKDEVRYVYEPKFCPECGRKVINDDGGADDDET